MAEIRPLQEDDLTAVARLLHANLTPETAEDEITRNLRTRLIDDPWHDEELPSLVAVEDGKVVGFIASQVRRFRFRDKELRGVCCSDLTVAPDSRGGAAGALLLRKLLTSGQDLSFSDTANDDVARMWQAFGGHLDHVRATDWMIVLRPVSWLRGIGSAALHPGNLGREQIPVAAFPLQAVGRRIARRAHPPQEPGVSSEDVDAATLVGELPELTHGFTLRVDYDQPFLEHLFGEVKSRAGGLVVRLVRRSNQPIGWYAYVPRPSGVSRVLHVGGPEGFGDAVVGDLIEHAKAERSTVLTGRLEPHLLWPLRHRLAVLGFARQPVLHTHDSEVETVLGTGGSLMSQLDGEWFVN